MEVLCEVRFAGTPATEAALPGVLLHRFGNELPQIEALPQGQIPAFLRESDPNLRYAAVQRLSGDKLAVIVGPHSIGVACSPYIGWDKFSEFVGRIISATRESNLFGSIERYSLKYTNFLPTEVSEWGRYIDSEVRLGSSVIASEATAVRAEFKTDSVIEIVQVFSGSMTREAGVQVNGFLVDLDLIKNQPVDDFASNPLPELESLHQKAKDRFFDLVTEDWVNERGPKYA